jgi:hypothetical protein
VTQRGGFLEEMAAAFDADEKLYSIGATQIVDKRLKQVLETVNEWHATYGYPGPAGPASDEVADNFILVDMMAKAATDKATPEEAVAWAQKEIELIYKKWSAA